ncbi:MAG: precorrin-6A reductase [Actinobacteria bacterium]|nr:precorrin-6A reductase [Actinomycetota bacterium]
MAKWSHREDIVMYDVILFGGTTEGRELADFLVLKGIPSLVCVATEYGEQLLSCEQPVDVLTGRLDEYDMGALFSKESPRLVIDATHPYASEVSTNLKLACSASGARYERVSRQACDIDGCRCFTDMDSLVRWLDGTSGVIFSTLGAKEARALTAVSDFEQRVFMRMLPSPEGIADCIEMGYPASHLYCMQGPFSEELNQALFKETSASILVTKESGSNGGFEEKIEAARQCGMHIAVLTRPEKNEGCTVEETKTMIVEVCA